MPKKSLTLVPTGSTEHRCITLRLDEDGLEVLLIPIEATAPLVEVRLASDAVAALREFLGGVPTKRTADAAPRSDTRKGKTPPLVADEKRGDDT